MTTNTAVVLRLEEVEGCVGLGYAPTFGFGTEAVRSHIAEDFLPHILHQELGASGEGMSTMIEAAAISGRLAGSGRQALAVLEMALLDIESQLAGMPLHQMWGQPSESVRAYASGGWRYFPVDELIGFASERVERGFDALKVQVGLSPREDAARLRALRHTIGPDVKLMVDANNLIPSDSAVDWISALAPYEPAWLEDPFSRDSHEYLASLRRLSPVPVAAGERETEPSELMDLLMADAVDVIQPDVHRVGLSAARAVCKQACTKQVVVSPHMAHEVSAHLVAGMSGDCWLEYFDWFEDWWDTPVIPISGAVTPSAAAGHGLRLRPGWLDAHRCDRSRGTRS